MANKNSPPPAYPAHQDAGPYIQSPQPVAPGDNRIQPYNNDQQLWHQQQYGSPSPALQQQYGYYGPPGGNPQYSGNGPYSNQYNQGGYGPPPGGMYYQYQQHPQGGYYYGENRGGVGGDICAGLLGALACCCCLDALFWI